MIDVVAAADPLSTMGQDDAEIPRPVAIESDGTEQYRTMSVRERSRLRPQLLERMGWRYMPLWTIEVFTDPSACADRIAGYLGLENVLPPGRGTASGGFFDEDMDPLALASEGNDRNDDQAGRLASEEAVVVTPRNADQADTHGNDQADDARNGNAAVPGASCQGRLASCPTRLRRMTRSAGAMDPRTITTLG
ncbi:protein involved in mismatch repair [Arthrobacter sp. Hiyo4]|nr:protein involved in mismatch repair [Arthrobacter sp. Hiyo4]